MGMLAALYSSPFLSCGELMRRIAARPTHLLGAVLLALLIVLPAAANSARAIWHPTVPPSRSSPALALDTRRHALLLYGGWMNTAAQDYLWEIPLDTVQAFRRVAAGGMAPPLLDNIQGYAAGYDSLADRLVLLGGYPDGSVWTIGRDANARWEILPAYGQVPPARLNPAVAFDPAHRRIVLIGGSMGGLSPQFLDDVWVLELGGSPTWYVVTPQGAAPAARDRASLVYDRNRDRFVLVGGRIDSGRANDAWSLTLGSTPAWAQVQTTGTPPAPRSSQVAVYDPSSDRVVMHGGEFFSGPDEPDLWSLKFASTNVAKWGAVAATGSPPRGREFHAVVYDPAMQAMVTYGGWIGSGSVNDCMALALSGAPQWINLALGLVPPPAGFYAGFRDPRRDRVVVIPANTPNEIWWAPLDRVAPWTHVTSDSSPSPRFEGAACVDSSRDQLLLFGGFSADGVGFADTRTWTLSLETLQWSFLTTTGEQPSARGATAAVFDEAHDRMLMYGGSGPLAGGPATSLGDLWALDRVAGAAWSKLEPQAPRPSARAGHAATLDPTRGQFYISGGDSLNQGLADCWRLDLASLRWTKLAPQGDSPRWCSGHVLLWNTSRDALMVLGSQCSGTRLNVGIWTLDAAATSWTRQFPLMPTNRGLIFGSAVMDPGRDRVVVLGGVPLNDTDPWVLGFDGTSAVRADAQLPRLIGPGKVDLTWVSPDASIPSASLYRKVDEGPLQLIAHLDADYRWTMLYQETQLSLGNHYQYQLVPDVEGHSEFVGELDFSVFLLTPHMDLRCYPNPARGSITVRYTLPVQADPGTKLEMFDVLGRRVYSRTVGMSGMGAHTIELPAGLRLSPGHYLLRLSASGDLPVTTRVVVVGS